MKDLHSHVDYSFTRRAAELQQQANVLSSSTQVARRSLGLNDAAGHHYITISSPILDTWWGECGKKRGALEFTVVVVVVVVVVGAILR